MGLEAEHDGLGDGAEGSQRPGHGQQQPREPRGGAVQDREDRGAEPDQGNTEISARHIYFNNE